MKTIQELNTGGDCMLYFEYCPNPLWIKITDNWTGKNARYRKVKKDGSFILGGAIFNLNEFIEVKLSE